MNLCDNSSRGPDFGFDLGLTIHLCSTCFYTMDSCACHQDFGQFREEINHFCEKSQTHKRTRNNMEIGRDTTDTDAEMLFDGNYVCCYFYYIFSYISINRHH